MSDAFVTWVGTKPILLLAVCENIRCYCSSLVGMSDAFATWVGRGTYIDWLYLLTYALARYIIIGHNNQQ